MEAGMGGMAGTAGTAGMEGSVVQCGAGMHFGGARGVERAFGIVGTMLSVRVDGAMRAILADLGSDLRVMSRIFMIAQTTVLVAHVMREQTEEKLMRLIDQFNSAYDGATLDGPIGRGEGPAGLERQG